MSVRLLIGSYDSIAHRVALVDSVTETAFGPLFDDEDDAADFLDWLPRDAREYDAGELARLHSRWHLFGKGP